MRFCAIRIKCAAVTMPGTRWLSPTSANDWRCISTPRRASRARRAGIHTKSTSECRTVPKKEKGQMSDAPLKIVIVDDEAPARRRLRELLDDCTAALPLMVVGEAASGREALSLLGTTPADLVLTDIHMPDMDGIELARHLLKLPLPPVLIFTTAFHEHAIAAFEVHAIDYLMKPVRVQRLLAALQKVPRLKPLSGARLDRLPAAARRFLSVTERSRVVLVPVEEVIYLKAELKYITIRTADREFLLEESLTKLEEEFGARFVRVHRNCLVAREAIRGFERRVTADGDAHWEVMLRGGPAAPPGSRPQPLLRRHLGRESSA